MATRTMKTYRMTLSWKLPSGENIVKEDRQVASTRASAKNKSIKRYAKTSWAKRWGKPTVKIYASWIT